MHLCEAYISMQISYYFLRKAKHWVSRIGLHILLIKITCSVWPFMRSKRNNPDQHLQVLVRVTNYNAMYPMISFKVLLLHKKKQTHKQHSGIFLVKFFVLGESPFGTQQNFGSVLQFPEKILSCSVCTTFILACPRRTILYSMFREEDGTV